MVSDHEMLNYLERHRISYQIVLTKCDQVRVRPLARRITYMNRNELDNYDHMIGPPIPISALKKQNLDALRNVINQYAHPKEIVVDGVKKKVYDLLELRRHNLKEKRKRKKEKVDTPEEADSEKTVGTALNSWGVGVFQGGFWTTDDIDSLRVQGFIESMWGKDVPEVIKPKQQSLFPDISLEDEEPEIPEMKDNLFVDDKFITSFDLSAPVAPIVEDKEMKSDGDALLQDDDVVTEEERQWGIRGGKHFDPSFNTSEQVKFLYHRDTQMSLDDVHGEQKAQKKQEEMEPRTRARVQTPIPIGRSYVKGTEIPKGTGKWKVLGKPRLKVPAVKYKPDAAVLINARDEDRRRPGAKAWKWQEATKKWLVWASRARKRGRSDIVQKVKQRSRDHVNNKSNFGRGTHGGGDA